MNIIAGMTEIASKSGVKEKAALDGAKKPEQSLDGVEKNPLPEYPCKEIERNQLPKYPSERMDGNQLPEYPCEGMERNPLPEYPCEELERNPLPEYLREETERNPLPEYPREKIDSNFPPEQFMQVRIDDNGKIYADIGGLLPNNEYELNGYKYYTDAKGRIVRCEGMPRKSPENNRNLEDQRKVGDDDRKQDDQGGHIIARDLNGDGGIGNLIPMNARINQSDYKRMEGDVKKVLDEGKDVTIRVEIKYEGDSKRPSLIKVMVDADGKQTEYIFDNEKSGVLIDEIPDQDKPLVEKSRDMVDGEITSIKKEYSDNGELKKTTVTITYQDENGDKRRKEVVIENN